MLSLSFSSSGFGEISFAIGSASLYRFGIFKSREVLRGLIVAFCRRGDLSNVVFEIERSLFKSTDVIRLGLELPWVRMLIGDSGCLSGTGLLFLIGGGGGVIDALLSKSEGLELFNLELFTNAKGEIFSQCLFSKSADLIKWLLRLAVGFGLNCDFGNVVVFVFVLDREFRWAGERFSEFSALEVEDAFSCADEAKVAIIDFLTSLEGTISRLFMKDFVFVLIASGEVRLIKFFFGADFDISKSNQKNL